MSATLTRPAPTDLFIGGKWRAGPGRRPFRRATTRRPATSSPRWRTAHRGRLAAVDAAAAAAAAWAATAPRARAEILRRAFELMTARADDLRD